MTHLAKVLFVDRPCRLCSRSGRFCCQIVTLPQRHEGAISMFRTAIALLALTLVVVISITAFVYVPIPAERLEWNSVPIRVVARPIDRPAILQQRFTTDTDIRTSIPTHLYTSKELKHRFPRVAELIKKSPGSLARRSIFGSGYYQGRVPYG